MLQDYLNRYEKALSDGDTEAIRRMERELSSIGMDAATLRALVKDGGNTA